MGGDIRNICAWDKTIADYPRLENERSDDQRIMCAAAGCVVRDPDPYASFYRKNVLKKEKGQ